MSLYEYLFNNNKNKSTDFGAARHMNWAEKRRFFGRSSKNGYCLDGRRFLKEEHLYF